MHRFNRFNRCTLAAAVAAALLLPALACAQQAPAGAGSTGNFPVITVPPPPMTGVTPTQGADSTLQAPPSEGGPQDSSITIPMPTSSGSGGTPPPPQACVPGSMTTTQPAQCPVGQTVQGAIGGPTTFTQSSTSTTVCNGNVAETSTSPWSPSVANACAVPGNHGPGTTQAGHCVSGVEYAPYNPVTDTGRAGWYRYRWWEADQPGQNFRGNPANCTPATATLCGIGPQMPATCGGGGGGYRP